MLPFTANEASSDQYSLGINASISASRSAMMRSATDCTRPALNPRFTFCHKRGLIEYPTMRSSTRLACWASTRSISISLDCLIACLTAFFVISLKVMRLVFFGSSFRAWSKCHEIASPSRSGSVARYTLSAFFTSFRSVARSSPFPLIVIYFGSKSFSKSTPIWLFGKSRTCPLEATTI